MKLSFTAPFILSILAATSTVSGAVLEKRVASYFVPWPFSISTISTITPFTPKPLQPGTRSNCSKYHLVAPGQTCATITATYGISQASFIAWNSGAGASCSTVWAGYYVCVGI